MQQLIRGSGFLWLLSVDGSIKRGRGCAASLRKIERTNITPWPRNASRAKEIADQDLLELIPPY